MHWSIIAHVEMHTYHAANPQNACNHCHRIQKEPEKARTKPQNVDKQTKQHTHKQKLNQ